MGELKLADAADRDSLRAARLRDGLTQADLADLAGVTRGSINRWESGRVPNLHSMHSLAKVLRVSFDDIRRWYVQIDETNVVPIVVGGRTRAVSHAANEPADAQTRFLDAAIQGLAQGHATSPAWNATAANLAKLVGVEWHQDD